VSSPDEFLQIDTPENVVFGYEVAGIASRFMAALADHFIIVIMQVIVYAIVYAVLIGNQLTSALENLAAWVAGVLGIVSFLLLWGYYIVFEAFWNGQTPGKRMMKLRVIRVDGTPITLVEALIRNLARLIDFLPISYGIGIITMFINSQSRRLGDLAAGTLVVFDRSEITLESLRAPAALRPIRPAPTDPPVQPGQPGEPQLDIPVERLSERDVLMVEDYLRRRRDLAGRAALAAQIAQVLHTRMQIPYEPMRPDAVDAWFFKVVTAYRQRSQ
jgi:uncharacterized RDD family membrane protein YckC